MLRLIIVYLLVCLFIYNLFNTFPNIHCIGRYVRTQETVLDSCPMLQITKASPEDQAHAREVTGLEVIDTDHSTNEAIL